jgi:hypothetical protein
MPNSVGQSTDNDKAGLCLFGMKFTAVKRRKTTKDVIVVCEGTSPKAVPSSSDSNYQLHSCRPSMPNSVRQSTDDDKAGLCLFCMKFTAIKRSKG